MQYKTALVLVLVAASGGSVFLIHDLAHKPVCAIAQAEERQRELNSSKREFQCGQWLVNRHADGEGRVFYELGNCSIPTSLRSRIEQGNERIDEARSLAALDRATERVAEDVRIIGSYVRAQKQAKGVGQATRNIYRGLYR